MIIQNRFISGLITRDGGWLRIGYKGLGLGLVDHRKQSALYSERNGKVKYIHIGPWCLRLLPPVSR